MPDQYRPGRRRADLFFRAVVTCEAVLAFLQAAFAGGFLSGHYGALGLHEANAQATVLVALVQTVTALVLWRLGREAGRTAAMSAGLFVAEGLQMALGYQRTLALHVPLGVLIIGGAIMMLARVWRPVPPARQERVAAAVPRPSEAPSGVLSLVTGEDA